MGMQLAAILAIFGQHGFEARTPQKLWFSGAEAGCGWYSREGLLTPSPPC